MTPAQKSALLWLRNRNADGGFDRHQVLLAGGEKAPVMRGTWNALAASGMVEFYQDRRRVRVAPAGLAVDLTRVAESSSSNGDGWTD